MLSGGYLLPHYVSVSINLVACEQALLGLGGGRGKEDPPPRELARRLSIWGNWRCWRLSLLKDCRLKIYAPHSQTDGSEEVTACGALSVSCMNLCIVELTNVFG